MATYRIEIWKKPKLNYRLLETTGKPKLLYATVQGFERLAGLKKNLHSIRGFYNPHSSEFNSDIWHIKVEVLWKENARSKKTIKTETWEL